LSPPTITRAAGLAQFAQQLRYFSGRTPAVEDPPADSRLRGRTGKTLNSQNSSKGVSMKSRIPDHSPGARPRISSVLRLRLRPVIAIGGGLAVAAAVTGTAVPLAQAAARSPVTTIRLESVTKATTKIPFGIIEADIDKNGAGKVVGADSLVCRGTSPSSPPKCAVSVDLAKGDLFFVVTGTRSGAAGRVVGGTGVYAKYSGTVTATTVSATRTEVVIKLRK
jgi:hypothetical protein